VNERPKPDERPKVLQYDPDYRLRVKVRNALMGFDTAELLTILQYVARLRNARNDSED
jgi:hypothetical protein